MYTIIEPKQPSVCHKLPFGPHFQNLFVYPADVCTQAYDILIQSYYSHEVNGTINI